MVKINMFLTLYDFCILDIFQALFYTGSNRCSTYAICHRLFLVKQFCFNLSQLFFLFSKMKEEMNNFKSFLYKCFIQMFVLAKHVIRNKNVYKKYI